MDNNEELSNTVVPQNEPIIIRNVRGITRKTLVKNTNEGKIVQELVVVEVDSGAGTVITSLIALAIVFVGVQIVAFIWRKFHSKSFQTASTLTLLLFPFITSILAKAYVFMGIWIVVAAIHAIVFRNLFFGRRPQILTTNIYSVYRSIFRVSIGLSALGYFMIAFGFFSERPKMYKKGLVLLMYVLYYTLIVRTGLDFISYKSSGTIIPSKKVQGKGTCPLCREEKNEKTIELSCREVFHESCLKNWKILGKKDTCPSCKEKVDLSQIAMNPWQKNELVFTKFLDFTGNLILAYAVTQGIVFFFGL